MAISVCQNYYYSIVLFGCAITSHHSLFIPSTFFWNSCIHMIAFYRNSFYECHWFKGCYFQKLISESEQAKSGRAGAEDSKAYSEDETQDYFSGKNKELIAVWYNVLKMAFTGSSAWPLQ